MKGRTIEKVAKQEAGERLDRFLVGKRPDLSRSAIQRLIEQGMVTLNGEPVPANHKTREGETFTIVVPPPEPSEAQPEDIPLDIVYEDDDIVIINKPAGMVVHPAKGHMHGTLVNALLARCGGLSGIGGTVRPGIVHRIDKDTTGLLAVAKNDAAHAALSEQLKTREMGREYLAVIRGVIKPAKGKIDKPIGRHPLYRTKMSVRSDAAREAVTLYETLETYPGAALLRVKLKTGRTHQIRVHLAAMKHPLMGDTVYGKERSKLIARPALHAEKLTLIHPVDGRTLSFTAPLPADFSALLEALRKSAS